MERYGLLRDEEDCGSGGCDDHAIGRHEYKRVHPGAVVLSGLCSSLLQSVERWRSLAYIDGARHRNDPVWLSNGSDS